MVHGFWPAQALPLIYSVLGPDHFKTKTCMTVSCWLLRALSGSRSNRQQALGVENSACPRVRRQRRRVAAHQGFDEQRDSDVGGTLAPALSTCCSCCPAECILVGRCQVPDISHSGAQDAQGKPGPATACGDAYGEKEDGSSANAAAPARALAGKAAEDGATALLGAEISVRPCPISAAYVPCCQSCQSLDVGAFKTGLNNWSATHAPPQEGEEEKLLAPESAAEEEERLRQHRKQETERALQVTP